MIPQHFFVGSHYLGSREVSPLVLSASREFTRRDSYNFFCPRCGEVWGRMLVPEGYAQCWNRECLAHGGGNLGFKVEGTGGYGFPVWEEDWPPDATAHEFRALLLQAEKRNGL